MNLNDTKLFFLEEDCVNQFGSDKGKAVYSLAAQRIKVSKEWSKFNGVKITPEMINCSGCRIPGAKTVFCDSLCPIRQCAREKKVETCGGCPEMESCEKVGAIIGNNSDARGRLENNGYV